MLHGFYVRGKDGAQLTREQLALALGAESGGSYAINSEYEGFPVMAHNFSNGTGRVYIDSSEKGEEPSRRVLGVIKGKLTRRGIEVTDEGRLVRVASRPDRKKWCDFQMESGVGNSVREEALV